MKDKKMILTSLSAIIILIALGGALIFKNINKEEKKETPTADALKFKEEYESLNNTERNSSGAKYNNIDVPENNPIKYVSIKETLEVLKNENAVIYIGANWCPWCRNAVPVMFEVAKKQNIDTIYYLNFDNEKSLFEVKDGKVVKTHDGTSEYYELLEYLDEHLSDYVLTKDGKDYKTGEKRIYMPTIITTKNGKVIETHTGTIELNENQTAYDALTTEQHDELYQKYSDMFSKVLDSDSCSNKTCD